VSQLRDAVIAALDESRTLASLRDIPLPALMSGKLRVQDAEEAVSAVV
jgi:type I restriction enzyme S subunit